MEVDVSTVESIAEMLKIILGVVGIVVGILISLFIGIEVQKMLAKFLCKIFNHSSWVYFDMQCHIYCARCKMVLAGYDMQGRKVVKDKYVKGRYVYKLSRKS